MCESAIFVVNGVMGVEVSTRRLWERAQELGVARLVYVNMLDRERADFFRTLDSLKEAFGPHVVATEIPIGSEHERPRPDRPRGHEGLRVRPTANARRSRSRTTSPTQAQEYREKLMDEVAENSEALMERYLEGEEISHEEIVTALEDGTDHGHIFPVTCGVATSRLGANRLLDAIVDDLPVARPARRRRGRGGHHLEPDPEGEMFAYVFKTRADPFAGRDQPLPRLPGHDDARHAGDEHPHPSQGARRPAARARAARRSRHADAFGPGDIGAVAKLKETHAGDWLAARDQPIHMPSIKLPAPVMAFAMEPKNKGDEDKVYTALRRLQEEDPTIDLHRDEQTGEQIVAGLSQIHVEVIIDRMKSRFGAEVTLQAAARALPGDDPRHGQGPRAPQEADRRPRPVRRLPHRDRAAARRRASSSSTRSRAA